VLWFARLLGRWPVALACVVALAAAVLLPGLGRSGLWEPQERQLADRAAQLDAAPGATAATPEPSEPAAPASSTIVPSPSTVILGPRGTAASAASEPNRVTRPVTEAEAERHLKGVLERTGEPAARCTKTQYSGGWVTVCD
jgi:hypothetical protein